MSGALGKDRTMLAATKITFHRAEGPHKKCRAYVFAGPGCWSACDAFILLSRVMIPADYLGCDKCDVTIEFESDERGEKLEYKFGYELRPLTDPSSPRSIATALRRSWEFCGLVRTPVHMTRDQHADFLKCIGADPAVYIHLLATYEVPS